MTKVGGIVVLKVLLSNKDSVGTLVLPELLFMFKT